MSRMDKELTEQQKKFCVEYLNNNCNGLHAALAAGYAPDKAKSMACSLLRRPHIRIYMDKAMEQLSKEKLAAKEWVLKKLVKVVDICIPESAEIQEHIKARDGIAALSEINKMEGYYLKEPPSDGPTEEEIAAAKKVLADAVEKHKRPY